jgi:hypothetical protein
MANISDILNRPAEDVKPPPTIPAGSYLTIVKGLPEQGESSKKKTPYLRYSYQITAIGPDVDEDEVKAYEADGEHKIIGSIIKNDYYTTEDALFILTGFLEDLEIDFSSGKSVSAAIDESPNREVVVYIKHEPSMDGRRFFAKIAKTAKASDLDQAA